MHDGKPCNAKRGKKKATKKKKKAMPAKRSRGTGSRRGR